MTATSGPAQGTAPDEGGRRPAGAVAASASGDPDVRAAWDRAVHRGRLGRPAASLRRVLGVVRKEVVELCRQPGLLAILVIGPLGILLLFGSGVRTTDPALETVFVAPEGDQEVRELVEDFAEAQDQRLTVTEVTTDGERAERLLADGDVRMVVSIPPVDLERLEQGERAEIQIRHTLIDPIEAQAVVLFAETAVDEINDLLVTLAIEQSQQLAADVLEEVDLSEAQQSGEDAEGLLDRLDAVVQADADALARPLRASVQGIGGGVTTSQFYAPAVIALILQHLTLTFAALSVSGERTNRTTELLQVSPLRPTERLAGKVIAFLLVGVALGALLLGALVLLLGTPLRGGLGPVAAVLGLELLAAIGIGFVLAAIARTTTQVVQGAMLLLLLGTFFGGLLLSPERLLPWARPAGWPLPMTHAIDLLRDSMLQGVPLSLPRLLALVLLTVLALGVGGAWLVRVERAR
jgi:ABC-2 type transport system permease protein